MIVVVVVVVVILRRVARPIAAIASAPYCARLRSEIVGQSGYLLAKQELNHDNSMF